MADSKVVNRLDQRLIREKIIDKGYSDDYSTVHRMLNSVIKKNGGKLTEKTFEKGEAKLRKWLIAQYKRGASQEKLTSYLRCGLAHLSFDFIESSYRTIDNDDLISRTLLSFKKREFHKTYFKAPDLPKPKKKKPVKKKAIKNKSAKRVKKKTKIKAEKKKSSPKKKSKVVRKKAPVKRKAAKKSVKRLKKRGKSKKVSFSRRKKGGFLKSIFG